MQNSVFRSYKFTDKQLLAEQVAASYMYGLVSPDPSQAVTDSRKQHSENIVALERTLQMYGSRTKQHNLVVELSQRLEQEQLWLKHYERCLLDHQKAVADMLKKVTEDKTKDKKRGFFAMFSEEPSLPLDPKTKRQRQLAKERGIALAYEIKVLADVEAAAQAAFLQQQEEKRREEERKKQEANNKNKNKSNNSNGNNQQRNNSKFLMEVSNDSDGKKNEDQDNNDKAEKA